MIIKVTYSAMYGTDQSARVQFVRVGEETHFVEVDGETWLRVDDMMNILVCRSMTSVVNSQRFIRFQRRRGRSD